MCGINGFISRRVVTDLDLRINRMNEVIRHRGPDAVGYKLFEGKIAFGQRRLSIIDIDPRSNQPMSSQKGNVLIFNGEIYNFKEIRSKITDYHFVTESDTEIILAGIETRGIEWLLNQCNGMFAFAYYDKKLHRTFIVRDRLGIKPLYYYRDDDKFIFSSEIKGILASGVVAAEFNEDAVDEYLANRYIRAPYTFFNNIYQIPPGMYITVVESDSGINVNTMQYWRLTSEFNMSTSYDTSAIEEEFEEHVIDAIKKRMIADVTVGTYLSGGVDSSLISAIAALISQDRINSYTTGFFELNEFSYAQMVADEYNTAHHEILIDTNQYFDIMREVISYKDAPLGVPNEIPLAIMSKILKKDITVVLSGEGADELMGGYGKIFRSPYDYVNLGYDKKQSFYDYFIGLYEYVPRWIRDKYLTTSHSMRDAMDTMIRGEFSNHLNEENVFRFFHTYHVEGLLQRVDTTTMLASVEARVPFLDHELIDYCYKNVPYNLKLHWKDEMKKSGNHTDSSAKYSEVLDIPKYLLRKIALKYLPEEIITRKKIGFPVPLNLWLAELEKNAAEILNNAYWIKTDHLQGLIKDCSNEERSGQIIWMLINIELFRNMYFEKRWLY